MEFICQDCSIESVLRSMPKMKRLTLLGAIVHILKGHKVIRAWESNQNSDFNQLAMACTGEEGWCEKCEYAETKDCWKTTLRKVNRNDTST